MATHEQPEYRPRPTLDALLARSARPQAPSALGYASTAVARQPKTLRELQVSSVIPPSRTRPDEIVLLTIETHCAGCGRTYRSPNQSVMLLYGKNMRTGDFSGFTQDTIPRVHKTHRVTAPHCEHCFTATDR